MVRVIPSRNFAGKRSGKNVDTNDPLEFEDLLTQIKLAEVLEINGSFPSEYQPYAREKGDYFYDGRVPVPFQYPPPAPGPNVKFSNNYFEDLRDNMKKYLESMM